MPIGGKVRVVGVWVGVMGKLGTKGSCREA
jgi:hypothetical protein